jgi:CubicO group peptidase (beta-lactamase class C family)
LDVPGPDTRFKLFSTSKVFTGALIQSLVSDGLIDLDAPITRYVGPAPDSWSAVTVRSLLHHNSGIRDHTGALLERYTEHGALSHAVAMTGLIAALAAEGDELMAEPGGEFAYNNFGYELLVEIGRRVAGREASDLIETRVLQPAGMTRAVVDRPLVRAGEVTGSQPVEGLIQGFNGAPGEMTEAVSYSFVQQGAGAILASANDLLAYSEALQEGRAVSASSQARSIENALVVNEAVSYGYGEMVRTANGCTVLQHSGGTNGFVIDYARAPEREITVAVLSNFGFARAHTVRTALLEALTAEAPCGE